MCNRGIQRFDYVIEALVADCLQQQRATPAQLLAGCQNCKWSSLSTMMLRHSSDASAL